MNNLRKRPNIVPRWLSLVILSLLLLLFAVNCSGAPAQRGWSGATLQGNILYVGSRDGRVISVDVSSSSRTWASDPLRTSGGGNIFGCSQSSLAVALYGTPVVSDNEVYVGAYDGRIYSFVPGEPSPDRPFPKDGRVGAIVGSVVVQGATVFFGADDGKVYSLSDRLQQQWTFKTGAKIWSTPAVQQGILYVGSFDKKVYALDASTGAEKWEFTTGGVITATPVVVDGTLYVGSFDQSFYALDAASGHLKWRFEGKNGFWATPIVVNGTIYAPALDGKVYVISTSGEKIAAVDLNGPISSSPVLVGSSVILATEQSPATSTAKSGAAVWSIDTATNQGRELVRLGGEKVYAPLAAGQGSVYVHTDRDSLYGVDVSSGALRQFAIK